MPRQPATLIAADLETDPFQHGRVPQPFTAGWTDGTSFKYAWGEHCIDTMLHHLTARKCIVYMHNGGRFDFHFFYQYADEILMIRNRIAKMRINETWFCDSFLLIPVALAASGQKQNDFDYKILEADLRETHKELIVDYLKDDCLALYGWIERFRELFGKQNLTLPTTALKQLRKLKYPVPALNDATDARFRPYYHGGYVGAKRGRYKNMLHIDINSSYPFAMMQQHPWGESHSISRTPQENNYFATIKTDANGWLPVRTPTGLSYPAHGETETYHLTHWEIEAAEECGLVGKVEYVECINFPDTVDFIPFVEKFYEMKLQAEMDGDMDLRLFAKLLMNSLYGRFGINPRTFEKYEITRYGDAPTEPGEWRHCEDTAFDTTIWAAPDPSDKFVNVAAAASITGLARANLMRALQSVESPVYWDTDCIICRDPGDLPMGDGLGAWAIEADYETVTIVKPKLYGGRTTAGKVKAAHKGVQLQLADIEALYTGAAVEWLNDAPSFSIKRAPSFVKRKLHYPVDAKKELA